MVSLKKKSEGFTIVELLIVIVVIAILATLVIVTFTGIQKRARDSQRQTDINALDSHIEAYFAEKGVYPTLANLQDPGWIKSDMPGLDPAALADPNTPDTEVTASATGITGTVSSTQYGYVATPTGCDNSGGAKDCTGFTVSAQLENSSDTYSKSSNT